jgi:hypothetical protein
MPVTGMLSSIHDVRAHVGGGETSGIAFKNSRYNALVIG